MKKPVVVGIGEVLWDDFGNRRLLGGAPFNVVYHAHALGARAHIISRIGTDGLGREILARMHDLHLDSRQVQWDRRHATGRVRVRVSRSGSPAFHILPNVAWDHLALTPQALRLVKQADAIVFGTLAQRSPTSRHTIAELLRTASCRRICDVNLRQHYFSREVLEASLSVAHVLKCNDAEFSLLMQLLRVPGRSMTERARSLLTRFKLELLCVTRGASGCVLFTPRGQAAHRGFKVKVADTVGSGDAFTASMVLGILAHRPLREIARQANLAGAYVAALPGATPEISPEALRRFARTLPARSR